MKSLFQYQTGQSSFLFNIKVNNTGGVFSFGLGCLGLSKETIILSGESGLLKTESGLVTSSYTTGLPFSVSGNFYNKEFSLFVNNSLVATNLAANNSDINSIFVDGNISGEIGYVIGGGNSIQNKTAAYITSDAETEKDFINLVSGVGMFSQFKVMEDYITGNLSGDDVDSFNQFDIIFVGIENNINIMSNNSGWENIETPIMFFDPEIAGQSGLNMISGQNICLRETIGYGQDNFVLDRCDRIYGSGIRLYTQHATGDVFYHDSSEMSSSILSGIYNKSFISYLKAGQAGYSSGIVQNGGRWFFSILRTGIYSDEFSTLHDNWKKIVLRSVFVELTG